MKTNVLLEIGTEEIPARFVAGFIADLREKTEKALSSERIKYSKVVTLGTPRRLALYIDSVDPRQVDVFAEKKGPPKEQAFHKNGEPTQAAIGFAKSAGVPLEKLQIKSVGDREYVFVSIVEKGRPAEIVLKELFPKMINSIYLPLAMRWGEGEVKFIRPIHWILALYGDKIIKFELAGVMSGKITFGHRYFGTGKPISIAIADLEKYKKALIDQRVVVDQEERREKVRSEVLAASKGKAIIEEDL
ncbi:MAG: glycine--tRNA ligase subunit beta, partial [Candidatus Saganbacteria bacterium]|nr:glycine--tRNA ligase subunit beta [Candidatus Saganbacteria bacterium]